MDAAGAASSAGRLGGTAAAAPAAAGALVPAVDTAAGTPDGAAITGMVQAERLLRHRSSPRAAPGRGPPLGPPRALGWWALRGYAYIALATVACVRHKNRCQYWRGSCAAKNR